MVAFPHIQCQLHDHAWQYDNDEACHSKRNGGKLHGNISRNGYGNAMIGRYVLPLKLVLYSLEEESEMQHNSASISLSF